MKIVVAPDSYKGSLSAKRVGEIIQTAFEAEIPDAQIVVIPMSDGGEGILEAILYATGGQIKKTVARGPYDTTVECFYGKTDGDATVVIEVAQIIGLPLVAQDKRNPMFTTSYGVGEVILEAINNGSKDFLIGLGGSATNDGGLGTLHALGVSFFDEKGLPVMPIASSLSKIQVVDFSTLDPRVKDCRFKIASDVQNPLCGKDGATYIFGPQKGATTEMMVHLEMGMSNFARLIEQNLRRNLQQIKGAGAAGGLGFAFLAIGGEIFSGAQLVAEAVGLEAKIKDADWVITGEGQSDDQTLLGKAPFFVAKLAQKYDVNALLISGGLGKGYEALLEYFVCCHAIIKSPMSLEEAMANSEENLYLCSGNIARLLHKSSKTF